MAEEIILCPHCNQELSIDDSFRGKNILCPLCNNKFIYGAEDFAENQKTSDRLTLPKISDHINFAKSKIKKNPEKPSNNKYNISFARLELRNAFAHISNIDSAQKTAFWLYCILEVVKIPFYIFSSFAQMRLKNLLSKAILVFSKIKEHDMQYLEALDILPRYGKSESMLVAEKHTLFSPLLEGDYAKIAFVDDGYNETDFIYSTEEVTKLYTFEDQLFVYRAVWDYSIGCICAEQTEAFFFKDITDISTETVYNKIEQPDTLKQILGTIGYIIIVIGIIVFSTMDDKEDKFDIQNMLPVLIFVILGIIIIIVAVLLKKPITGMYRASESLTITASSGRSISSTIVCEEWIEANKASYTHRSDPEKIIQAIRKMIEEKKAAANE